MQAKRNVRADFDKTKDYRVNVLDCTLKMKKKVQQAFFDVGIDWHYKLHGVTYLHLDAGMYTNVYDSVVVTKDLMMSYSTYNCNMTAKEFLNLVYEDDMEYNKGHVHAELMAQYAEDAKTHAKPWKLWQIKGDDGVWRDCLAHPNWANATEYRGKPKTHVVHGVEIPVFEFRPKVGEEYYAANVGLPEFFEKGYRASEGCTFTQRMNERRLLYPYTEEGKEAAILHSKSMLGIA